MHDQFFDYNSTTPVDPAALKAMLPYFSEVFANPSGQTSKMSWQSQSAINKSKSQIADLLGARASEVIFTSGATESINWVFKNFIEADKNILISNIEHDASWESEKSSPLKKVFKTTQFGQVDESNFINKLEELKPGSLVSFLHAHNELGTILNFKHLTSKIKSLGHFIHLDSTQAVGKIKINFKELEIDFLSCSAHKHYGPKGIGALVINSKTVANFSPLFLGGGQQDGLRSGTLNTPLIVGFGASCEVAKRQIKKDQEHYKELRALFFKEISALNYSLNQDPDHHLLNTINITFHDWKNLSAFYLELLPFSVSQSSACSSENDSPRVLKNLGISAANTLRISFGRPSTKKGIFALTKKITSVLKA